MSWHIFTLFKQPRGFFNCLIKLQSTTLKTLNKFCEIKQNLANRIITIDIEVSAIVYNVFVSNQNSIN